MGITLALGMVAGMAQGNDHDGYYVSSYKKLRNMTYWSLPGNLHLSYAQDVPFIFYL